MPYSHKHIILCSDGVNGLGLARSLGEAGLMPILVSDIKSEHLVDYSKYISKIHYINSDKEIIDLLINEYGVDEYKPFLYVGDDYHASLLDRNYDLLIDKFFFFNAGSQGALTNLLNKNVQLELAQLCDIRIPKKDVVKKGILPRTIFYPVITKTLFSTMGKWKGDSYICKNEQELKDAYSVIEATDLVIEEFLDKKNELEINGFAINNGEDIYISYDKLYFRLGEKSFGHYMFYKQNQDDVLLDKIKKLMKKAKFNGMFDVEILVDANDNLYFMEVNWRSWMSNYAHTQFGVNIPYLWAKSTLNGCIDSSSIHQTTKYFTALNEIGDFLASVRTGKITFFQWLKELWQADSLYYFNRRDIKPMFVGWWHLFKRRVNKTII